MRWKSELNYAMKYLISIVSSLIRQAATAASNAIPDFLGDTLSPVLVSVFYCELSSCPGVHAGNISLCCYNGALEPRTVASSFLSWGPCHDREPKD